jgi:hypothetical protein
LSESRLDHYLGCRTITPNIVKIDAEGAEIPILRGAQNLLTSNARILCELHPYAWPDFDSGFEELRNLLHNSNRRIRYLDPECPREAQKRGAEVIYGMTELAFA